VQGANGGSSIDFGGVLTKLANLKGATIMQVNVHDAKSQLSKLIDAALRGEEVIIARNNKPVVRLVALPQRVGRFKFGLLPELAGTVPDFLEPMSEEELRLWE
jgi:prevent-host-death family protein